MPERRRYESVQNVLRVEGPPKGGTGQQTIVVNNRHIVSTDDVAMGPVPICRTEEVENETLVCTVTNPEENT